MKRNKTYPSLVFTWFTGHRLIVLTAGTVSGDLQLSIS